MKLEKRLHRFIVAGLLVLALTSCGQKAVGQEVGLGYGEARPQISTKQLKEVPPPEVIQELRPALELYQPQVSIITPKSDEVIQENTVKVNFQVKDLPIFKDPQLELGPHLHFILDNQPYIAVFDLDKPLVLSDLSPGTHTLRVFASRPWDESFKNEGAYTQTTFHVFTKTDDNNPEKALPTLTYNNPQGSYGAEPILIDFYLTNAPLHLVAKNNPNDKIGDWRIRCTINEESFILDRWQPIYLKGFKPGKNWVKLEFLDGQGNPIKNVFNNTARLITYEPKGKDTLSKITRGEVTAEQVRFIVDQNYQVKTPTPTPTVEPTSIPTPTPPKEEKQPLGEVKSQPSPQIQVEPTPNPSPTLPEIIVPQPEITPEAPKELKPSTRERLSKYFTRPPSPTPTPSEVVESSTPNAE